jgi:hypothetical protein
MQHPTIAVTPSSCSSSVPSNEEDTAAAARVDDMSTAGNPATEKMNHHLHNHIKNNSLVILSSTAIPSTTPETTTQETPVSSMPSTNNTTQSSSFLKLNENVLPPTTTSSTTIITASASSHSLEERVEELEFKLATLSRLLRLQQSQLVESNATVKIGPPSSPTILPPRETAIVVPMEEEPVEEKQSVDPHDKRHRNLSLTLLFEGNEEEYNKDNSSAPPINSMTLAEREWLRPKILYRYNRQNSHDSTNNTNSDDDENNNHHKKAQNNTTTNGEEFQNTAGNILSCTQQNQRPPLTYLFPVEKDDKKKQQQQNKQESQTGHDEKDSTSNATIMSTMISSPPISPTRQRDRSNSCVSREDVDAILRNKVRTKWLDYLNSFQESAPDVDVQMEEFIKVPPALESIMGFGFWICVDSFLYMVTILPIRFVWSCLLLLLKIARGWKQPVNRNFQFHRRHVYQLIQVNILYIVYNYVLAPISIGKLYHWIRGQSMIKLYVIIAMVEVFDRLLSSLGQDCLESMYWNTVSRPRSSRMIISILVVAVYAAIHALILFVHVETLNVAMNSADEALLTLLISGNFAEIKSTVFKKYNKAALFKITASDICERFKLALFLSLVLLLNICQGMDHKQFGSYMRICGFVWCAELLADWIKHAFITKFNFLPARVYPEYALLLAGDVTGIGHEGVNLDHSHAVVKRIGFAQIPLLCLMFRLLKEAAKYASATYEDALLRTLPGQYHWRFLLSLLAPSLSHSSSYTRKSLAYLSLWICFLSAKLALGRLLQRIALRKLLAAPEVSQLKPLVIAKQQQQQTDRANTKTKTH